MKHISLELSESDVQTALFTLSFFPSLDLADNEMQADINYRCCCSAIEKLADHRLDITPNEIRVIILSIQVAQMICHGEAETDDPELYEQCMQHLFAINKLAQKLPLSLISDITD